MQLMKGFPVRPVPVEGVGEAAKAVARRQAEQLTLVRRKAQPTAVRSEEHTSELQSLV